MAGIITRFLTRNPLINAIAGNIIWNTSTIDYSFLAPIDEARVFSEIPSDSEGTFHPFETEEDNYFKDTVLAAFAAFERVADLTFNPVTNGEKATIKVAGIDNYSTSIGDTAGTADLPGDNPDDDSASDFESFLLLNTTTPTALLRAEIGGANSLLSTTLHELGHSLGLDHPHDSRKETIPITGAGFKDPNDIALDNRRYTLLSYEDGGLDVLYGLNHGHSAGPVALDIAALQAMYGANPTTNQTDTVYTLTDPRTAPLDLDGNDGSVQIGRAFFSIWDTGGIDTISYGASNNVLINLNDATLDRIDDFKTKNWIRSTKSAKQYNSLPTEFQDDIEDPDYHAGGFFSRIFRNASPQGYDLGGFSIANGVTIENAIASSGHDFLIGNTASNHLRANGGEDFLHGSLGNDILDGGSGADELDGGGGNDILIGGFGPDVIVTGLGTDIIQGTPEELDGDRIKDFEIGDKILAIGSDFSEVDVTQNGLNTILTFGSEGAKATVALQGDFTQQDFVTETTPTELSANTIIELSQVRDAPSKNPIIGTEDNDRLIGSLGKDLIKGNQGGDFLRGNDGNDRLVGAQGNDVLVGGPGDDRLVGGMGFDVLTGGMGRDRFIFQNPTQMPDEILDFEMNQDIFLFKGSLFGLNYGDPLQPQFTIGSKASTRKHRFIYNNSEGQLLFDSDGTGSDAPILMAELDPMLPLSHTNVRITDT